MKIDRAVIGALTLVGYFFHTLAQAQSRPNFRTLLFSCGLSGIRHDLELRMDIKKMHLMMKLDYMLKINRHRSGLIN